MRVLISGATGFVGKSLEPYLRDHKITNIEHLNLRYAWEKQIKADVSIIIHLAGKAHDLKHVANPDEYYQVNFELTKRLYAAFLASDAKKFVFISTVKAVADQVDGVLTEDIIPNPQTHYGKSKLMAEEYIRNQVLPSYKSYYILRPCMIHGPGNKGNLNLLYKFVKRGIPYPLAGFKNKRSFLSVENLCFVINELITRDDIPGGIYQVADDEALSTSKLISILSASLNIKTKLWKIPPEIIIFLAKIGDWLKLPLTSEQLNKLTESYVVSNHKMKHALKKELPLTAVEGLKITANSFSEI